MALWVGNGSRRQASNLAAKLGWANLKDFRFLDLPAPWVRRKMQKVGSWTKRERAKLVQTSSTRFQASRCCRQATSHSRQSTTTLRFALLSTRSSPLSHSHTSPLPHVGSTSTAGHESTISTSGDPEWPVEFDPYAARLKTRRAKTVSAPKWKYFIENFEISNFSFFHFFRTSKQFQFGKPKIRKKIFFFRLEHAKGSKIYYH